MHSHRFIIPLLILVTLATFWRAASCQFINLDDDVYVFANQHVLQGLTFPNITWAFTTDRSGSYLPLTWLSLMLNSDLLGTGPGGYHIANILLHALAAALLYLALQSLTAAPWRSALVALIFAIHPLRVESVAWISERKDVLSGCLAFSTLLAYAAYAKRPNWGRYLLVIVLFILGLMAKPVLVTVPFILILLDIWPLRRWASLPLPAPSHQAPQCSPRSIAWLLLEKIPLLALSLGFSIITYVMQVRVDAVASLNNVSLYSRLANIPVAYTSYLTKMVWFRGLIILYPMQRTPLSQAAGATFLLLLITGAVLIRFRTNPWLAVGWFWFLGMLVPVIGFVQAGFQSMADRYSYLPTIGLLIMLVWSVPEGILHSKPGRVVMGAVTLAMVVALGCFTWRQIGYWQDNVTLFGHSVDCSPDNIFALTDLGQALDASGQPEKALFYCEHAVEVAPYYALAHINLAKLLQRLGERYKRQDLLDEGLRHLHRASELEPDSPSSYNAMGTIYMSQGKADLALHEFQRAVELDPDFGPAHANMGDVLAYQHHFDAALSQYQLALTIDPNDVVSGIQTAKVLMAMGRTQQSLDFLRQIIQHHPDLPEVHIAMGQALSELKRYDEAIVNMRKAVELDPGNPGYQAMLAQVQAARTHDTRSPQTMTPKP